MASKNKTQPPQENAHKPIVAAFDFDGTITYRDTLLPFILFSAGIAKSILLFLPLLPYFISYVIGRSSRQATKERVISAFFRGTSIEDVRAQGAAFAQKRLKPHLKPEALRRLDWHKKQGHRCVLVSANLDVYLHPWAKVAGFDDAVTSIVEAGDDERVTGKLVGLNCWGPEKTRRLEELLGPRGSYDMYAYGDSRGDMEMLASADHAFFRKMPILEGATT